MKKTIIAMLVFMISAISYAQTVEVKYFHGKQRCVTCQSIEKNTKVLLEESFAKEIKSKKIKLSIIDFSTEEGAKIAKKYKVTWSSLFVENGKIRKDLTRTGFQYARNNPDEFKRILKKEINSLLKSKE